MTSLTTYSIKKTLDNNETRCVEWIKYDIRYIESSLYREFVVS